jgi:hypothetical protein
MRLSRNLAGGSSALSSRSHRPTHGTQGASSGRSLAALGLSGRASGWDFLDMRAGSACDAGGRRTEGGQKAVSGGQRTPVSVSNSKRFPSPCPAAVQRVLSGFSAGSQKVLRRCLICRLARKCLDLLPVYGGASAATLVRCRYSADRDSGRARGVSPISRIWRVCLER